NPSAIILSRLFGCTAAVLSPVVVPGVTPVLGGIPSMFTGLLDFVLNSAGSLYVRGALSGITGVLAASPAGLSSVAKQTDPLPVTPGGPVVTGLVFGSQFALMPDSVRGPLLFRAYVAKTGQPDLGSRGLFRMGASGLETIMVEGLTVNGARN